MSKKPEKTIPADTDYSISSGDDTVASSISLSISENSVRLREKSKAANKESENSTKAGGKTEEKKWWLKRPETRLGTSVTTKNIAAGAKNDQTPDATSSMKEFLEKEEMCKAQHKQSGEINREKDDTLCDILASTAFDKYPSDFENATDEDIGSFLEEMSKIAGALSPSSAQERIKSGDDSNKNPTEEEKSVEELLVEAEKLVRKNVALSKSASRSETFVVDEIDKDPADDSTMIKLEKDIFQLIEQEVQRETEKIRKSPKNETKRREIDNLANEIINDKEISLKPPTALKLLDLQRKQFDEDKIEVSSSSDLDDPIDRHSKSEDPKKMEESRRDKDNLQKEITDVDKDFFDDLLRRSKEKIEGGMSGSSSFGQEDFSHFLRILQGQDKKEQTKETRGGILTKNTDDENIISINNANTVYPEREITEILEKELPKETNDARLRDKNKENHIHDYDESDSSVKNEKNVASRDSRKDLSENQQNIESRSILSNKRNSNDERFDKIEFKKPRDKSQKEDEKKSSNSTNELYNVDLTPRLKLFADAIPKLIAEKTNENIAKNITEMKNEEMESRDKIIDDEKNEKSRENDTNKAGNSVMKSSKIIRKSSPERSKNSSEKSVNVKNVRIASSKSYDQLPRPGSYLRSSLDDVRSGKSTDSSRRVLQHPGRATSVSRYSKQPTRQLSTSKQPARVKSSLKPTTMKFDIFGKAKSSENPGKYCQAGGDSRRNLSKDDLEILFSEERHKNALLKDQIESEAKIYKQQMENMRISFEEELFSIKKQNIILKAKVDELSLNEKRNVGAPARITPKYETRIKLLEKELEKQEGIINAYETENKKLVTDMERMQEELKNSKIKRPGKLEINETMRLNDMIKDLRENELKLNLELTDLRRKNIDGALKIDDITQQNSLLKEELEMFKEQLRTKNDFINARLQAITASELESRKKTDEMRIDLSSKSEQLKNMKIEYARLEEAMLSMENELSELRTKDINLTEKLQITKSHVEREKQLTLKLKDQVILDNKKILDLNRQVREMERILKRKNPDSVSALILTAKTDHERINLEKIKLLEDRIASLEGEIRAKEEIGEEKLSDLQKKFGEMKDKYTERVTELEKKLKEATSCERTIFRDFSTQTIDKSVENKSVEAGAWKRDDKEGSSSLQAERDERKDFRPMKIGPKSQNTKEDAHLIATIRGLKMELTSKEKSFAKINRELQDLQKTNRRLQKEREKLLNERRSFRGNGDFERNYRSATSCPDQRLQGGKTTEANDLNSNHYQNGHLSNGNSQRLSGSVPRLYDPLQYSENDDKINVKKLTNENGILKEELNKINKDFMMLKNKRLHDLNLLQEEHEREIASLVKEYSLKFGDSKVVKLQGQINTQVAVITHLKQQIEKLRDYKEQVLVLKVEREHLENKVKILNEKIKYLSTPGTEQLQLLQDKITILQQRHESREMTLQNLVRDLLRNKTQCRDCKGDKVKSNKQLCYFRQELDNILGMLQEISDVR